MKLCIYEDEQQRTQRIPKVWWTNYTRAYVGETMASLQKYGACRRNSFIVFKTEEDAISFLLR